MGLQTHSPQHPIQVALVGTGFGLRVHLPALQNSSSLQVGAVYHRHCAQAEAIAQNQHIPQFFDDYAVLLAEPNIQGICLSTPPFLHYEMVAQALEAGKHVFLEKPVTMTALEARTLYRLSLRSKLQVAVDFEFRYVPAWMTLKAKLQNSDIGKLRLIKIDWLVPGRADPSRAWSWHASAEAGGGSLGALGSHVFDYISWLFGPVKQICARLITSIQHRPDPVSGLPKAVDADDTCMIMLELMDGTPIQVSISATTYQGRGHWLEIYGDRGTFKLGSHHRTDYVHGFQLWHAPVGEDFSEVSVSPHHEFAWTHADGRVAPVSRVMEHWASCIAQDQTAAPSIREGTYSQLLMDRAHESHETGCWTMVPDLEVFLDG